MIFVKMMLGAIWIITLAEGIAASSKGAIIAGLMFMALTWYIHRRDARIEALTGCGTLLWRDTFPPSETRTVWMGMLGLPLVPVRTFLLKNEPVKSEEWTGQYYVTKITLPDAVPVGGLGPHPIRNALNAFPGWFSFLILVTTLRH